MQSAHPVQPLAGVQVGELQDAWQFSRLSPSHWHWATQSEQFLQSWSGEQSGASQRS
jgi:hypothetical protein